MRRYLADIREELGLSQRSVAERLRISAGAYSLIENDRRQSDMNLSTLNSLAEALSISPEELFRLEQDYRSKRGSA